MKTIYVEMVSGISGDMFLAALVDAGVASDELKESIAGIAPGQWDLRAKRVRHHGLRATRVEVYGSQGDGGDSPASQASHQPSGHGGHHSADGGDGHKHGRTYKELRELLEEADGVAEEVRRDALEMLRALAEAEAAVHGVEVDEVHFHEVGGLDTLVDLAGAAAGLRLLGAKRVVCSPVPWSHGFVDTAHGRLPVPAPATVELLRGLPVRPIDVEGETVTPTGAAIVRHFADGFGPMPAMKLEAVGVGAGARELGAIPNIVRIFVGQAEGNLEAGEEIVGEDLVVLETNIDDMAPELFEAAMEACLEAGALDVWFVPIYMKRNRPAVMLRALAEPGKVEGVAKTVLTHTTSLGVRAISARRYCLPREMMKVETEFGEVAVKVARLGGQVVTAQPEYRECVAAARRAGVPVREVYMAAVAAAQGLVRRSETGSER